jgi:lysophospholipase L1-like esterase
MRFGLRFVACSGSVIDDFYNGPNHQYANDTLPQRAALLEDGQPDSRVTLVTMSFGGNDATFATIMNYCANILKKRPNSCLAGQGAAELLITKLGGPRGSWPGRHTLADLYADVRAAAPDTRVLVVGYPPFFPASPPTGCGTGGGANFTEMEMLGLNQTVDRANRTIKEKASEAGFEYVDVSRVMASHDVCAKESWINSAMPNWTNLSFHPTVAGQQAIADKVLACLRSSCTRQDTRLPADMQFLVGEWGGRYRSMVVKGDGTGEIRLLNPPADPGKPAADGDMTILGVQLEPGLTARITESNDPAVPVGGQIIIKRMDDPGMLEITTPDRTWGTATYCNPKTAADPLACG